MKRLPDSNDSLVVRTDFSDDEIWAQVRTALAAPVDDFQANLEFVDDAAYNGASVEDIIAARPANDTSFLFLADRETMVNPEHPALVVELYGGSGRTFRVVPNEMWGVENNLSLCNMDWEEFAESVDPDGVFRGFPA
jgi:hypothetical protein